MIASFQVFCLETWSKLGQSEDYNFHSHHSMKIVSRPSDIIGCKEVH